jgi:acetoin utilization deacetylase AcuC-like enzyme
MSQTGSIMRTWAHDRWQFPLPDGHRYPVSKHRLLRERLLQTGVCQPGDMLEAEPLPWSALTRVHDAGLLGRIRRGQLSVREQRGLGLPWSPELVERGRRASHGTVLAGHQALRTGVAINLGGGSHHAGRTFARGYCLFNDIALACDALRGAGLARRALVVDCDVHQGDGTADLLAADPDAFTLSLHGARNYPFRRIPSDLDIDLSSGTTDTAYLTALDSALATALRGDGFDIAFYLAGADPWEGDRLGSLALTKSGLRRRDVLVLDVLRGQRVPVCVVLAGGYAPEVHDIVDIHVATTEEVAARTIDLATRSRGRVRRERNAGPVCCSHVL